MASSLFQLQHTSSSTMPFAPSSFFSGVSHGLTFPTLGFVDLSRSRTVAYNTVVITFFLFFSFLYFIMFYFCFFLHIFYFFVRNVICRKHQMLLTENRLFPLSMNKHCPSSWNLRKPLVETVTSWNCSPAPLILLCPRYYFHFNLLSFLNVLFT